MFAKQNSGQVSSSNSLQQQGVDLRNIRTFVPSSDEGVSPKQSVPHRPIVPPGKTAPVIQRDFVAGEESAFEEEAIAGVPETSPFFISDEAVVPRRVVEATVEVGTNGMKNTATGVEGVTSESVAKPEGEHIPTVSIPKEGMRQRSSFQPITNARTVSESALSSRLSVNDYTTRDGFATARAKDRKSAILRTVLFKGVFVFLVLVLLMLAVWGGYSYWKSRSISAVQEAEAPVIVSDPTPIDVQSEQAAFKYEWKIANTIIIDETKNKFLIGELQKAVDDFSLYKGEGVLEFVFVDGGNNFSTLNGKTVLQKMGIVLSDRIASLIQDSGDGKVYLAKKGSEVRAVVAISVTSRDAALAGVLASESNLVKGFTPLYFGKVAVENLVPKFNDQVYREYAIRYFNVDTQKDYSLDYTFRRDTLLVATSKQSMRDVLDSLDGKVDTQTTSSDGKK